jgi:hypothetical protein
LIERQDRKGGLLGQEETTLPAEDPHTRTHHRGPGRQLRRAAGALCGYSLERIVHDYGLDLILFTYNASRELEDGSILLQVKATERTGRVRRGQAIPFRVSRPDVQGWLRRVMPVILIEQLPGFDLLQAGETITVHLPVRQGLTPTAVRLFASFRDRVLGQVGGSIHHDV